MPTFSVLVPVYNHERYIGAALDSLLAQTDTDWEACVVDDGSTDGTSAILDAYARLDARIRVSRQPNGGQPVALNTALRAARGEWICWLSSDDLFLPDKLSTHRKWIAAGKHTRFFYTDFEMLDDATGVRQPGYVSHDPLPGRAVLDLLRRNYINGISICVHRSLFGEVGGFDEKNRYGQDYDFFLRAAAESAPLRIPVVTCVQRVHAAQYTRTDNAAMFYDCAAAAVRFLSLRVFEALFPSVDLDNPDRAAEALETALDIALSTNALVNKMGPHPALLTCVAEWVLRCNLTAHRRILLWRLRAAAAAEAGTQWSALWRAVAVWAHTLPGNVMCDAVCIEDLAEAHYLDLARCGDTEALRLRSYIETRLGREAPARPHVHGRLRDVLSDRHMNDEAAGAWSEAGWRVTRMDPCGSGVRLRPWGWDVGYRSARLPVAWALCGVPRWEAAVGGGLMFRVASRTRPLPSAQSRDVLMAPACKANMLMRACGGTLLRSAVRWRSPQSTSVACPQL